MLRTLSPGLQVVIFFFFVFFMASVGDAFLTYSLISVVDQETLINANWSDPRVVLTRNLFFQVFAFLLAFMLILRFTGQKFTAIIAMKRMTLRPVLITFGIFIVGLIGMQVFAWLNAPLAQFLPASAIESEIANQTLQEAIVYQSNFVQFAFALIVMAVLPAICEELVFRGFLIKKMLESGLSTHAAVLLSASIFSLVHFQPLKFLPIFFLGVCLGYLYQHYKNIKYAILLHFLINGSQIMYGYLLGDGFFNFDF